MATRKDLLKAYGFTSQRLIKALVDRNPEDMNSPLRRVAMGTFASVMIGVLMFAAFGVVGWLNPAKTSKWQMDKTVVVDKTSGVVYAYLEDTLYPARNITSAKLATAGGPTVAVTTKSLASLDKLGATIGIADAPSALPDPSAMGGLPIRVCASQPQGRADRFTTMQIGDSAVPVPTTNPTVVVADDKGGEYLVIGGIAHLAPKRGDRSELLVDLGFTQVLTPGNAFVRGLPQGSTLDPPKIDGVDTTSAHPVGEVTKVGTVLELAGSTTTWYVLMTDGYAPISALEARALELQRRPTAKVTLADITSSQTSARDVAAPDLQGERPAPGASASSPNVAVCATWTDEVAPKITVDADDLPAATTQAKDGGVADSVTMPPLGGVLVQPDNVADPNANIALVTSGLRYGLADAEARAALGYAQTTVLAFPPQLIELIPQGLAAGEILSIPRSQQGR